MKREGVGAFGGTLEEVQARFEQWRRERRRLGPIPAELWAAAAGLTSQHTYLEVSKALRLNYNTLKERAQGLREQGIEAAALESPFVEVEVRGTGSGGEGVFDLEWEGVDGGKLRIRVRGKSWVDAASVVGALGVCGR